MELSVGADTGEPRTHMTGHDEFLHREDPPPMLAVLELVRGGLQKVG